jgi:hypothetical protein
MEKKLCFRIKSQISLEIGQTEAQSLNQLLFFSPRNNSKSLK